MLSAKNGRLGYEWGNQVFGEIKARGATINQALNELLYIFENHDEFKFVRHLLKPAPESAEMIADKFLPDLV